MDGGTPILRTLQRRGEMLKGKGIHYIGLGSPEGKRGAQWSLSLMPGGSQRHTLGGGHPIENCC